MKAITLRERGPAESLRIEEIEDPKPGPSDVIVDVSFAGINHGDIIRRERGLFPPEEVPPHVLGLEGSGVIGEVGKKVTQFEVGQRVAFLVEYGGYAQRVRVPTSQLLSTPDAIADDSMAGSVCVGLTAFHLSQISEVRGRTVLVHGGAGGVGSSLVQICKHLGAKVITTVGSSRKAKFASTIGAELAINRNNEDFASAVATFTHGQGVDVIFDCIGREVVDGNVACLRKGGLLLYYGSSSGHPSFPGAAVLMRELKIQGFVVFSTWHDRSKWNTGVEGLLKLLSAGQSEDTSKGPDHG